ncbi:hypothetical protein [Rhabdobacter roseus]|uniref:hypothetical protein n=1 Tax=Rhabdobacter roseus TaxID=1655419 RepID=UPI001612FD8D|nr:hypothetical protein [Rhabdobacter roseus]
MATSRGGFKGTLNKKYVEIKTKKVPCETQGTFRSADLPKSNGPGRLPSLTLAPGRSPVGQGT